MSHRALQILDAAVTAHLSINALGNRVYKDRELSLSDEDQELPAICILMGEDAPEENDVSILTAINSVLTLELSLYAQGETEDDALESVIDLRRQSHIALMNSHLLGLSFLSDIRYAGADKPERSSAGTLITRMLKTRWTFHYEMDIADPQ